MFESLKERKKTAKERLGRTGGELKLSAKNDEDARKYIGDTPFPDRFRYRESKDEDGKENPEKMKTVKSAFASKKDQFAKIGEFTFSTGWMEIGYDRKTKALVTSFKGSYRKENQRINYENRPYYSFVNEEKVKSNDKSFQEGVVSLKTPENRIFFRRVIERWETFSDRHDNNTTYDAVEPFHQTEEQKDKLDQLKNMRRQNGFKDSGLDKAITGITTYKNREDNRNVNYKRKFQEVIEKARIKIKSDVQEDILLYLLKKKQMEEQQALLALLDEEIVKKEMLQKLLVELLKLKIKQLGGKLN